MDTNSYYHLRAPAPPPQPPLTGETAVPVGVVGGGLAGLATVLALAERGVPAVLLEATRVGSGASGRNGGMVSSGFAASLAALDRAAGPAAATELVNLSRAAMAQIRGRVADHAIACDLAEGVVVASWFDAAAEQQAEVEAHNRRFATALAFWPRERLRALYPSQHYWDGIFDPEGFHLDPLALARGYAAAASALGAVIHEDSPALAVERHPGGWRVATPAGVLLAERLVLCQSAYPPPLLKEVARSTLPVFTYVIVTEPLRGRHAGVIRAGHAVYDTRFATGYYRLLPDGRLLWGGRISTSEHPRDLAGLMQRDLAHVYPQLAGVKVEHAWSGRMGFTRHRMPIIRELEPGLWVNTGFGGHGLNTTTMGGELVAAAIAEGDERWRLLAPFAPRWVGGPLGRLAAQAIYWRHIGQDAVRAAWQRRSAPGDVRAPRP